jgi:beta-mannosidase
MTRKDIKTFKVKDTFALFEIHQEVSGRFELLLDSADRFQIQLWGCNSSLEPKAVQIELEAFDLDKGSLGVETYDKTLEPNASTEIWKGDVPGQLVRTTDGQVPKPIVVQARLKDSATGEILARYSNWPEPWKYLIFPDPGLSIDVDGDKVTLNCKKPIKGLVLDVEGDEAKWSDQAIDLFPGDTQVVTAAGLKGRKVLARYIGDGSA